MKKILLIILLSYSKLIYGQGVEFNTKSTWDELLALSESTNKLIFLDCYTTWCGPCKGMDAQVFPDKTVGDFMNVNFICTKRDMEKGEGLELNIRYKSFIPGYPTYLLINSKGEVVFQVSGFMNAEKFIKEMKNGLAQKSWIVYKRKFESGERSWEFIKEYLELLEVAYQSATIEQVKTFALDNINYSVISESKAAYDIFRKYWKDVTSPVFKQFISNTSISRKHKDSESDVNAWAGNLYERALRSFCDSLIKSGVKSYDLNIANDLLFYIRKSNVKEREDLIARILVLNTIAENNLQSFFSTIDSARSFGLLRNYSNSISLLCRRFFSESKDTTVINKCIELTKLDLSSKFLSPELVRNYAFFIEKSGDKKGSEELYQKADIAEKELKEKFGKLLK